MVNGHSRAWRLSLAGAACVGALALPTTALADDGYQNMYRLYNRWSGEHLYTADLDEAKADVAAGWRWEGVGWVAPTEGKAVYRLYNPFSGDHHYTMSEDERDGLVALGWEAEGVGWRSAEASDGIGVLREFNPYETIGTHNYTTSEDEDSALVELGWRAEGVAWYAADREPEAFDDSWLEVSAPSINRRMYDNLDHGPKPAANQRYIVLHDTEGTGSGRDVIDWWASNGNQVAAHFVVDRDGTIWQCVELDRIAHHAGYGDTGHNALFGISEDGRDDMRGTSPVGSWASDYAMNAWSVGIEIVHVGGGAPYTEAQLESLDELIAYIDAYYGFESDIIDHKAWRSGNSDTSLEFATYLANYQRTRRHDG